MSSKERPPILHVVGALAASLGSGALVIALLMPADKSGDVAKAKSVRAKTSSAAIPPLRAEIDAAKERPVATASFERAVPPEVLKTATVSASPDAPELRLARTVMKSAWEERRAEIEDLGGGGGVRGYAIGDLLPHGSLLVGISTTSVDIMVGDTHLIRLHDDGRIERIEDLSQGSVATIVPLKGRAAADPDDEDKIRLALIDVRSEDPTRVQAAIDQLIGAGEPAIDLLMPHVDSLIPVRPAEYAFPAGGDLLARPHVLGDVVMLVLERITGQKFGDATKQTLDDDERRQMASAWRRWWSPPPSE